MLYMTPEQHEHYINEMKNIVADTIRTIVNGKIDGMRNDLTNYIKEDTLWKNTADPYIKLAANISGTWKFLVYVVVGVLSFFGLYSVINKI